MPSILLIGSDHIHLIAAHEPGFAQLVPLRGHSVALMVFFLTWQRQSNASTTLQPTPSDIYHHVAKLWQLDILPYSSEKFIMRSCQDQEATAALETGTKLIQAKDCPNYASPFLHAKGSLAWIYNQKIPKLVDGGCMIKL